MCAIYVWAAYPPRVVSLLTSVSYRDSGCKGSVAYNLQYPGISDLRKYGINDNAESILCWVAPSC